MLTGGTTNAGIVRPSQNSGTQILVVPTNADIAVHLTSFLALQRLLEGSVSPLQGKLINKEASVLRLSQTYLLFCCCCSSMRSVDNVVKATSYESWL